MDCESFLSYEKLVLAVPRERERNLHTRDETTQINRKTKRNGEMACEKLGLLCVREKDI